jgi:hypothetical protein
MHADARTFSLRSWVRGWSERLARDPWLPLALIEAELSAQFHFDPSTSEPSARLERPRCHAKRGRNALVAPPTKPREADAVAMCAGWTERVLADSAC